MDRGLRWIATVAAMLSALNIAEASSVKNRLRPGPWSRIAKINRPVPRENPQPPLETAFIPYWIASSLTRVARTTAAGTTTAAAISAAQNEYEAFQIVVRAPDGQDLSGVDAQASDLTGPGVLSSRHIALYREHYVRVTRPSPGSPYAAAEWPDALIPFVNPETGQPLTGGRLTASPFALPAGTNQPLYVEVYVPSGTPAGVYSGRIVLSAIGRTNTEIPVTVRVRDFTLPDRPSLRSKFTGYGETAKAAEYFGLPYGSPQLSPMADRFNAFLLQHRLTPNTPDGTAPYVDRVTGHIDARYSHAALRRYFEDQHASGWTIPFSPDWPFADPAGTDRTKAVTYLSEMATYLESNGWFGRTFVELYDEPDSAQAYATIRAVADVVHSVRPDYKVLVTEQPLTQDARWGTLVGAVDIWAPLTSFFDEPSASAAQSRGEEVWSYTEGSAQPAWLIDFPLLNGRISAWVSWRYGLTGLLYWTPWYWEETNPWDDAGNYTVPWGTYNGNGCLVYPGTDVGYAYGPIPSLRLKALRDGMEDYEYLKLLSDRGQSGAADGEALSIGTSFSAWNPDPTALEAARERIATQIEAP
jgi:glycosyl hydrolase family 123